LVGSLLTICLLFRLILIIFVLLCDPLVSFFLLVIIFIIIIRLEGSDFIISEKPRILISRLHKIYFDKVGIAKLLISYEEFVAKSCDFSPSLIILLC